MGVEALVRWQHPVRGLLGLLEFVELAERTDLILPGGVDAARSLLSLLSTCRTEVQDRSPSP